MCIRLGLIWNLKNVARNPIGQSWPKIAKIAKIVKFRDFPQIRGLIIPKIWRLSKFPCTHILICSLLTQVPKDIWIGQKLQPQWPFKNCDWEMAIIVAICCYICIIILSVWSYLHSCAMRYLRSLYSTLSTVWCFYIKLHVFFVNCTWIHVEVL